MEFIRNFDYMSREEKTCMYLINMRPVLNSRGLFHDCTEEYRNPSEPDKNTDVFIKFRTVKIMPIRSELLRMECTLL